MTQLQINAADYGLEEIKAKQISDMFKPMLDKMTELEVQYNEVIKRPMEPETIQMAHDLRLAYVKVRTGTAAIHKDLKAFYLQGGRFVDGWKNAQLMASQGIEEKLKGIEDHFVNIKNTRIEKLKEERAVKLRKFDIEFIPDQLGEMDPSVWDNYISGVKLNYEAQKEAEQKAEKERLDLIEKEKIEQERIRKENEQLKIEAEERERSERIEKEIREKEEIRRLTKEREEREAREQAEKEREEKELAEQKIREEKAQKEREVYEAKLENERKERERIAAELKAKEEAERKAKAEEEERIQAELNMGDADKVKGLIYELNFLKKKYVFRSKKNQKMYSDVGLLIDKVIKHIQ